MLHRERRSHRGLHSSIRSSSRHRLPFVRLLQGILVRLLDACQVWIAHGNNILSPVVEELFKSTVVEFSTFSSPGVFIAEDLEFLKEVLVLESIIMG